MSFTLPPALTTLWAKLETWFGGVEQAAAVIFTADEQAVLTAFKPILNAAEGTTLSALIAFATSELQTLEGAFTMDLPTLEAKLLNTLEVSGGQLFTIAKGLGSNLFQALIAVLLASIPKAV